MKFNSTRGLEKGIASSNAIINGLSKDGGLYVPDEFPRVYDDLKKNTNINYQDLAFKIIDQYFTDIDDEELKCAINDAYEGRFDVILRNNFLELYHGPTSAFKDAALLFLPQIMKRAKKQRDIEENITILTATSGDTGKAALEGFSDVEGFNVVVYYPQDGVSAIQKRQMATQRGNNVKVVGINGNFDDAQTGVKKIFSDEDLKEKLLEEGHILSSANSINIGRLVPQIVYYFYGYFNMVNQGTIEIDEPINVVVPTGNFGNILASYYAKQMGLPIRKFICASNENKVLSDFFNTGTYDKKRELILTESPSMDILVSSNLERLLYEASGRKPDIVRELMDALQKNGDYKINIDMKNFMRNFYGDFATEDEVKGAIEKVFKSENYLMDTHTAVAYVVNEKYQNKTQDDTKTLIVSTASPFKFARSICESLDIDIDAIDDFGILNKLAESTQNDIPKNLVDLDKLKVLHKETCNVEDMKKELLSYLGL